MPKDLSNFPADQFVFLLHNLINKKRNLKDWANNNDKFKMAQELKQEIELLIEIEKRLEKNGL